MKKLTTDDKLVWHLVKKTIKPLRLVVEEPMVMPIVVEPLKTPAPLLQAKAVRKAIIKPMAELEKPLVRELSRGKKMPERSLDLHGMRQEVAFTRLQNFLQDAQLDGLKLVIVVTGKGASGGGVLKNSVPDWLELPSFRHMVIGYAEAGRFHGRDGALYVRVRKA